MLLINGIKIGSRIVTAPWLGQCKSNPEKNNVALDRKASLSAKEDSNQDYKLFENSVYLGTQTLLKGGIENTTDDSLGF